jgi:hypothetical protein
MCCSLHSGDSCSPCRLARAADGRRLLAVGLYEVPPEDVASSIALAAHSAGVLELAGVCGASVASEMQERWRCVKLGRRAGVVWSSCSRVRSCRSRSTAFLYVLSQSGHLHA